VAPTFSFAFRSILFPLPWGQSQKINYWLPGNLPTIENLENNFDLETQFYFIPLLFYFKIHRFFIVIKKNYFFFYLVQIFPALVLFLKKFYNFSLLK